MIFRRFFHPVLAQASYLIGCTATGDALVVDPHRDVDQYIAAAHADELGITAVTETHIHADFVSGTRELAHRTGARVYLSAAGAPPWTYKDAAAHAMPLQDGEQIMVGTLRIDVLHTPGHTPEHLAFVVTDTASANVPLGILTGDWVFAGEVGRPDLLETVVGVTDTMHEAARQLFQSLDRFRSLPDWVQVWPGHGAGSVCGRAISALPHSTVGYEKRCNWALRAVHEQEFVQQVLDGQPAPPPSFAHIKQINQAGPALVPTAPLAPHALVDLAQHHAAGAMIIDTRSADDYAAGHIPGTLNLPAGASFLQWAGWLLPYDQPLAFISDAAHGYTTARLLRLIGLDNVVGFWTPAIIEEWAASGRPTERTKRIDVPQLRHILQRTTHTVLDVRTVDEYAAGHIRGSRNIPLAELGHRLPDIAPDQPLVVYCRSGMRSAIAASILQGRGRANVIDLRGGLNAWTAAARPVVHA